MLSSSFLVALLASMFRMSTPLIFSAVSYTHLTLPTN